MGLQCDQTLTLPSKFIPSKVLLSSPIICVGSQGKDKVHCNYYTAWVENRYVIQKAGLDDRYNVDFDSTIAILLL